MTIQPTGKGRLSRLLAESKPIVLDGALATYLEILGADISGALWSASLLTAQPALIKKTHLDYYAAGASIAITASYQASVPGLTAHLGISEAAAGDLIAQSVKLANEARAEYLATRSGVNGAKSEGKELLVAGSVGPYGAYLADGSEYRGDYSLEHDAMKDFHRGRIAALLDAGVDVLAIETIPSFAETRALRDLLVEEFGSAEAWVAFTVNADGTRIADGTPVADVLALLEECEGVVAVGINCVGEEVALRALEEMRKVSRKPLIVYPNSGEVWNAGLRKWEGSRGDGEGLREKTRGFRKAGARIIGGCCRSTPDDIAIMARTLGEE